MPTTIGSSVGHHFVYAKAPTHLSLAADDASSEKPETNLTTKSSLHWINATQCLTPQSFIVGKVPSFKNELGMATEVMCIQWMSQKKWCIVDWNNLKKTAPWKQGKTGTLQRIGFELPIMTGQWWLRECLPNVRRKGWQSGFIALKPKLSLPPVEGIPSPDSRWLGGKSDAPTICGQFHKDCRGKDFKEAQTHTHLRRSWSGVRSYFVQSPP